MGRYLAIWELDTARVPVDRKERGAGWAGLMKMVRQDIDRGLMTSWGSFLGEGRGYVVYEGSELAVENSMQQYIPFVRFTTHPVESEQQINEMIEGLSR